MYLRKIVSDTAQVTIDGIFHIVRKYFENFYSTKNYAQYK